MSNVKNNNISIIGGAGHIGLPLAVTFAQKKFIVNIIDKNKKALNLIKKNIIPFRENNLEGKLKKSLKKNIFLTSDFKYLKNSKYIIVCIGTPVDKNQKPIVKDFFNIMQFIKNNTNEKQLIIIRSSVYPGFVNFLSKKFKMKNLFYCPERITQGNSIDELPKIPQIISGIDKKNIDLINKLFKKICKFIINCEIIEAELAKIFSNVFRYINFSIPNEFFLISNKYKANFNNVLKVMKFKYPRCKSLAYQGFIGGPCLEKDLLQLKYFNRESKLLNGSLSTNKKLLDYIMSEIKKIKNYKSKTIGILGLGFKPENEDLRGSVPIKIYKKLKKMKLKLIATDPYAKIPNLVNVKIFKKRADIVIKGTRHKEYENIKFLNKTIVIDINQ
jgi:UDP-N-acetyl-D-mannosaminuronic acid dehydrogenase